MYLILREEDEQIRGKGHARVDYSSSSKNETVVETTDEDLSEIFANADADELAGTDEPIDAAIEDPLRFRDYLILEDGEIVFDEDYVRDGDEE